MNLNVFYSPQQELDKKVEAALQEEDKDFSLDDTLIMEKRRYAFHVELGELANEVGFFKYWKRSHKINWEYTLEEFVDCIHFLASIGLSYRWNKFVTEIEAVSFWEECPIEELFYLLRENKLDSSGQYKQAFMVLLGIGKKLGFSDGEIVMAYLDKNKVNHDRLAWKY